MALESRTEGPRRNAAFWSPFVCGAVGACALCVLLAVAFVCGRWTSAVSDGPWTGIATHRMPPELLQATATHGGSTMAVCTAKMDEEQEGFFVLDFMTGDLKGWVYYPRLGTFGGLFSTNVLQFLGPTSKNPEYLLVSGDVMPPAAGNNIKPAASVIYVVDVKMGNFAAFTVPWSKALKNQGSQQIDMLVPIGGDIIRPPLGPGAAAKRPPAANANQGKANANDPNAPANPNPPPKNNNNNN